MFPHVTLGEVLIGKPQYGSGASKAPFDGNVRYIRITDITDKGELRTDDPVSPSIIETENFLTHDDLLIARSGSVGRAYLHKQETGTFQFAGYLIRFRIDNVKALPAYVYRVVQSPAWWNWIASNSKTGTLTNINAQQYASFEFPLPPLEVQKEIVAEIEGYQKVIDGARLALDNYRPHIPIHPDWPMVRIDELCELGRGRVISRQDIDANPGPYPVYSSQTSDEGVFGYLGTYDFHGEYVTWTTDGANAGTVFYRNGKFNCTNVCGTLRCKAEAVKIIDMRFLAQALGQLTKPYVVYVGNPKLMNKEVARILLPLPSLDTQRTIVAEIEAEQALVNANRELISRMEKKIQKTLASVWGEDEAAAV
jgi:restriction endonuclease S subunit